MIGSHINISRKFLGFTLIELLITVIIIGILLVSFNVHTSSQQARARDTQRYTSMNMVASAIKLYALDHDGRYPIDPLLGYQHSFLLAQVGGDFTPPVRKYSSTTLGGIQGQLINYMSDIPKDRSYGLQEGNGGTCISIGDDFAYKADNRFHFFALTSISESKKGNADDCSGIPNSKGRSRYEVVGENLKNIIESLGAPDDPLPPQDDEEEPEIIVTDTADECFLPKPFKGTITGYDPTCTKDVVIGDTIDGIDVKSIASSAFQNKGLTSVYIHNNNKLSIGSTAFLKNNITRATILGDDIKIGPSAFQNNTIEDVIIQGDRISIGSTAFLSNTTMKTVDISGSQLSIGSSAFQGNTIEKVSINGDNATIGSTAFLNNNISYVTIHGDNMSIESSAFQGNPGKSVLIQGNNITIGSSSFQGGSTNTAYSVTLEGNGITVAASAFFNNNITDISLIGSNISLQSSSFQQNNISELTFNVVNLSIGSSVFFKNKIQTLIMMIPPLSVGSSAFQNNGTNGNSYDLSGYNPGDGPQVWNVAGRNRIKQ